MNIRKDLSSWLLHSTRERTLENCAVQSNGGALLPHHANSERNNDFYFWDIRDCEKVLGSEASPFQVLCRIIEDGHIRASWALRKNRPTIYGPRPAVCFTEMPLYAHLTHARGKGVYNVSPYAIAVRKDDFYQAGGRQVIYGLSVKHQEKEDCYINKQFKWPRELRECCGLSENEQYRYVATNLSGIKRIDWTHEREWRWIDGKDVCLCPGLPIWLEDNLHFKKVLVIVKTDDEAMEVLDILKRLYDAGGNDYDFMFCKETLKNTRVTTLEDIDSENSINRFLRIEDLRGTSKKRFRSPKVDAGFVSKVKKVLSEAQKQAAIATRNAIKEARENGGCNEQGLVKDVSGFASVVIHDSQSPVVSALKKLGEVKANGDIGYFISNYDKDCERQQALCVKEAAAESAIKVFKKYFPNLDIYIRTHWD